jgi:hypothetical protein
VIQLNIRRRLDSAKRDARSIRALDVDTIQKKHLKMDIEIEGTLEVI